MKIINQTISIQHSDVTLEMIKFLWITNIGDLRLIEEEIKQICNQNTIILLSGYSKKKVKKYKEENIKFLSSLAPVYYVWSHNDYKGKYRDLNALLLDCKVTILENTSALFESENGTKFSIIGLDDVATNRDNLAYSLEEIYDCNINILTSYTEVKNSSNDDFETISVYLFERSGMDVLRNQKTFYLALNNDHGFVKQNNISVLHLKVVQN